MTPKAKITDHKKCLLLGAPIDCGKRRAGCLMGPSAYRVAGLAEAITALGYTVEDRGDVHPAAIRQAAKGGAHLHALAETVAWSEALAAASRSALEDGFTIFLGGDHALSLGTIAGAAAHARAQDRPLFVLWLDAHPDFHTPGTTTSGNLHGTPVAYLAGRGDFDAFPPFPDPIPGSRIAMIGLRSVDPAERTALIASDIRFHDMHSIDETGVGRPVREFLADVEAADGLLHVSLDVDFLDPTIAPAVGTTVPGGVSFREAHLVMELLNESRRVCSLDLVELNPFLDERGRTANLMVDLAASLMGRKVFDRPTRSRQ